MQVQRTELVESLQIVADADRLTSRAGTALLAGLADRVGLTGALSQAMGDVRKRRSRHDPGRTLRDLDATLVTAHSDKEQAAGTYKHGFGFHPLLCYEAETQEALSGILRPGNAGANTACDHIEVFERALAQVPEEAKTA